MTAQQPGGAPPGEEHLIVVEDAPIVIERHIEDWLSIALFWSLAIVVFVQFFTRYVLNDSLAWTEEIARYLLMWTTFVGAAVVTRRGTHIAVEVLLHFLPEAPGRALRFVIDLVTLGFVACLAWFGVTIVERMHIQRMTIIELPMSIVYGGVALGVFLMLLRTVEAVWKNGRRGWRADPNKTVLLID